MAEIDWRGFAAVVDGVFLGEGLSNRGAVVRWPGTNAALWSRARTGRQPLSPENYLHVCMLLTIDPWQFWSDAPKPVKRRKEARKTIRAIIKSLQNQTDTARVSRESEARA